MKSSVRRVGNSSGVIIPQPMLAEIGVRVGDPVDIAVAAGKLVIAPLARTPRSGWADASRELAETADQPAWQDFGNDEDEHLTW